MTGLEYLQAMIAGKRPEPAMAELLNIRLISAEPGRVRFEGRTSERFTNPSGTIHGGWTAGLLDSAAALAAFSTLPDGKTSTTVDLHMHCLRPISPNAGLLFGEGQVINAGRTLILAESRVLDGGGRLLAHATSTCMVLERNGALA